jgi:hypothetical protein
MSSPRQMLVRILRTYLIQPVRRLALYLAAAILILAVAKGALLNLPGYIHRGEVTNIILGVVVWVILLVLAVLCIISADRRSPGQAQSPKRDR